MNPEFTRHLQNIEESITSFLPSNAEPKWQKDSFGILPTAVKAEHIHPLLETTRSLVDLGGKRWRPLLLVLCARASSSENKKTESEKFAYQLSTLVEFVHTASLIHDDIEDKSESRRGKPAAYITYGTDTAINAGSWLYFQAPVCINGLDCNAELKLRLYATYAEELRRLHLGQAMDIKWHNDNTKEPSQEEYIAMVKNKTGTLASLSAKIGTLASGADEETVAKAGTIAAEIGAGFQIIDDVINLTTGNPGKKRGDDIVEGKKSLPVLSFIEKNKGRQDRINALHGCFETAGKEGIDSPAVEEAVHMLIESGAVEESRRKGIEYISNGCDRFLELFGKDNSEALLIKELFTAMIPPSVKGEVHA
ncbi:polyprenyl synthetase family protein [Treponema sp.]|uniref:polyprenyl synthetase family protein n=1 Tax=Treponema sp. TaxID=166 RepID=UPI00388D5E60